MDPIKEVEDMLKDAGVGAPESPVVPPVVPPVEPTVPTEPEVPPVVVPPVVPPTVEPPPAAPDINEDNRILREKLNEMARQVHLSRITPTPPLEPDLVAPPPVVPVVPPVVSIPKGITPAQFISKEEADLLIDRPDEIMPLVLNRVFEAGREVMLRDLQPQIAKMINTQVNIIKKVEDFYNQNSDLSDYKDFVGLVGSSIEQEHPDWTIDQVYTETAKVSRERLRLQALVIEPTTGPSDDLNRPALPKTRGARGPQSTPPVTDENLKALEEMWQSQTN
jgi:hypothetical protein